jgi:2-C-methyl-D-erythritol 4-phosphate cytidylyltransferase
MTRRAAAVLLAAETSGPLSDGPPAFVEIHGQTLLSLSVRALEAAQAVHSFVVVAPPGREREAADLAGPSSKFGGTVSGGANLEESLRRALESVPSSFDAVVVHEVARPLATPALFDAVVEAVDGPDAADAADAALPSIPVADTLKRVKDGSVLDTVSREGLGLIQTPQAFRREVLEAATSAESGSDQRGVVWLTPAGSRVVTVPGEPANMKLRTRLDLRLAEALLAARLGGDHVR